MQICFLMFCVVMNSDYMAIENIQCHGSLSYKQNKCVVIIYLINL